MDSTASISCSAWRQEKTADITGFQESSAITKRESPTTICHKDKEEVTKVTESLISRSEQYKVTESREGQDNLMAHIGESESEISQSIDDMFSPIFDSHGLGVEERQEETEHQNRKRLASEQDRTGQQNRKRADETEKDGPGQQNSKKTNETGQGWTGQQNNIREHEAEQGRTGLQNSQGAEETEENRTGHQNSIRGNQEFAQKVEVKDFRTGVAFTLPEDKNANGAKDNLAFEE